MQVKVKQDCVGFIDGRLRKEGETFELGEHKFSEAWMIKLEEKAKPAIKRSKQFN